MGIPTALTIAGSDSSGSAGLQADLPTFSALGVHGCSVVTVVTAQNRRGIDGFHEIPDAVVAAQLDALINDMSPDATKTGLLRAPQVLDIVADRVGALGHLVIDPVSTGSDGTLIVPERTVEVYRALAPLAAVLTPNLWEIELLLAVQHRLDTDAVVAAAEQIRDLGAGHVVVTGGRGVGEQVRDVVVGPRDVDVLTAPRLVSGHAVRGTGCTFSAAITAGLAAEAAPEAAIGRAHRFVQDRLRVLVGVGFDAGAGRRPGLPHHE